jgi:regulator of protease activity HflC (stomatin/prohibitin superfamily)
LNGPTFSDFNNRQAEPIIAKVSQETLAEMIGTTRTRVSFFMNRFRNTTTAFSAEAALTKDTVPVNVDAIIFWFVHDAQKAALNITNYREATIGSPKHRFAK